MPSRELFVLVKCIMELLLRVICEGAPIEMMRLRGEFQSEFKGANVNRVSPRILTFGEKRKALPFWGAPWVRVDG